MRSGDAIDSIAGDAPFEEVEDLVDQVSRDFAFPGTGAFMDDGSTQPVTLRHGDKRANGIDLTKTVLPKP